jgi:hypothetical protein
MTQHEQCTPIIRLTNDLCVPHSHYQLQKQPHNIKQELYNEHTSPLKQASPRTLIARIASAFIFSIIIPTIWQNPPPNLFHPSLLCMALVMAYVWIPQAQFVQLARAAQAYA